MAVHGGGSPGPKAGEVAGGVARRGDFDFAATVDSDTVDGPSAGMTGGGTTGRARLPAHLDSTSSQDSSVFDARAMPMNIGRHELVRPLGMGGMGQVFEARAPDGTTVALKIIRGTSPERLYRFKREFRSLSAVVHPNIVALYDLVHVDEQGGPGLAFFTMELLRGAHFVTAIRDELADDAGLDEAGLRRLQDGLVGLACGLSCVHRHGLVHRDIKPSNVMITPSGRVVVLDLGLVRESRVASFDSLGENAPLLGTPLYMAPEQVIRSDDAGPAADWYAVGEVLWECLGGESRHAGRTLVEVFERKLMEPPEPPSRRRPGVPPHLDQLCVDLLAREPAARPSAGDVLTRLGRGDLVAIELAVQGLLGREHEARLLRDQLVQTGRAGAVFVSGPSGFGKTTLVEHVLDVVRREDSVVAFSGSCSERESIPFKALDSAIDALSLYLCNTDADATAIARPDDLAALARLFPILRTVPAIRAIDDSRLDGLDPIEIRRRAADSLAEVLTRIAARRPVVLALDDLQWADLDSVLLLESVLLRSTRRRSRCWAATARAPRPRGPRSRTCGRASRRPITSACAACWSGRCRASNRWPSRRACSADRSTIRWPCGSPVRPAAARSSSASWSATRSPTAASTTPASASTTCCARTCSGCRCRPSAWSRCSRWPAVGCRATSRSTSSPPRPVRSIAARWPACAPST
ncbi:serine/threonine-protein kinase [Nannocystis pusilla]|uniref:Serine/threonine-protein kinase n=1 Tax=Nannocystis pusilla TaxID=889268 RepID=A0A9X3EJY4_9BACT|nr:serine/threonine-protein kinase [Nannocystis pusilla]MCY1005422.1 serine/threonine-protein kinase [Nannocystis pusilla]